MNSKYIKKFKIPDKPGVYFFLKDKQILYIGKATSLRDRVKSYFGKDLIETRGPILVEMVFKADKIDWQFTDSVLEALILEANLIKKYQPYYNTKEKSDKSFNYVVITKEKLAKVIIMRGSNVKHSVFNKIYGPYTSGTQLREAVKIIRRIFPYLDDKSKNYMEFYRQINLVPDLSNTILYKQNIRNINLFFQGKKKEIVRNLKKEMFVFAKNRKFEEANEIKRQLFALQHINDIALIKNNSVSQKFSQVLGSLGPFPGQTILKSLSDCVRIEAYDIAHMSGKNMVGVMTVVENNEAIKNEYRKFSARGGSAFGGKTVLGNNKANDTGALREVLERRLAHNEWAFPDLIVVDGGVAQINVAHMILKKAGLNIRVVSVLKDERHKPKDILSSLRSDLQGAQGLAFINKYKRGILLANSEAHRFAIGYHKKVRAKNFLR